MKLDQKDVEAIAKSRVMQKESKKLNYYTIGVLIGAVVGLFLMRYSIIATWIVFIGSLGSYALYLNKLTKKQDLAKSKLVSEWRYEQK